MSEHPKDVRELAEKVAGEVIKIVDGHFYHRNVEAASVPIAAAIMADRLARLHPAPATDGESERLRADKAEALLATATAQLESNVATMARASEIIARMKAERETLAARPHPAPATDGESERLRVALERFDAHRLAISHRRPSAKRNELLSELATIRDSMCRGAARPAVEHDRAIEEARDRLYAETREALVWDTSGEAAIVGNWLYERGAMLPADRQRARDGQSGGGA